MSKIQRPHDIVSGPMSSLEPLIERLNTFSADNYWDLGKFLAEKVIPAALEKGIFAEQILKRMAEMPGFKFPFSLLKQCQRYYSYYPDVETRPLPELFYYELATKVEDSKKRDHYEKMAVANKWTISDLQKRIREDEQARREDEKTSYGFDRKEKNIWSFDTSDPRFGKPAAKGRLPGQIVANALFYYTQPGWTIVDPMAGSGTTGDVIESVSCFEDRKCRMYDIEPSDDRIKRTNILQTGIPEETGSVDYVFLDPPHDFYPRGLEPGYSAAAAQSDTMRKLKAILRESVRIIKPGGRVSIIVEVTSGPSVFIDSPFEVTLLARELGVVQIGKVYLPRRSDSTRQFSSTHDAISLLSECRELLTFEKRTPQAAQN
jgi:hypothetical protein